MVLGMFTTEYGLSTNLELFSPEQTLFETMGNIKWLSYEIISPLFIFPVIEGIIVIGIILACKKMNFRNYFIIIVISICAYFAHYIGSIMPFTIAIFFAYLTIFILLVKHELSYSFAFLYSTLSHSIFNLTAVIFTERARALLF